ncbi:hypothetical protein PUN28_017765 [Cardiocondyla obscurior]|uniref:Uncharacterized protein n=1 Tax=Cardiocondyla obscurior TaxID=286306 RepID=A0AAW2EJ21_9HYME
MSRRSPRRSPWSADATIFSLNPPHSLDAFAVARGSPEYAYTLSLADRQGLSAAAAFTAATTRNRRRTGRRRSARRTSQSRQFRSQRKISFFKRVAISSLALRPSLPPSMRPSLPPSPPLPPRTCFLHKNAVTFFERLCPVFPAALFIFDLLPLIFAIFRRTSEFIAP